MANRVGTALSRLIRDRAYAAGVLASRAARVRRTQAALDEAVARLEEAQALVDRCNAALESIQGLDVGDIRTIQHFPKSGLFKYGELTRELVRVLQDAAPHAVSTPALIADVARVLNLPLETPVQRELTRRRVVKQLQKYARKGAVARLHDADNSKPGQWRWIGL